MIGGRFGPYRVESKLGGGGMGEVYLARDSEHGDRVVALKVLPASLYDDPQYRARFRREAEHAARMTDPHIATIHRYGEIDGHLYLDMELVDGKDLTSVVAGGPLPPAEAVGIVEQVAAALDAVHGNGLVHRDIKPANVIVRAAGDGRPPHAVLIDFGIAAVTEPGSRTALTRTGAVIGTLAYLAPERFLGQAAGPPADVYALACVLAELLTGQRPFPGLGLEGQIFAHLHRPPPRPAALRPGVPTGLDTVVAIGMAKEPANRYPSAGALAAAARAALTSPPSAIAADAPTVAAPGPAGPDTYEHPTTPVALGPAAPRTGSPVRGWLLPAGAGIAVGALALVVSLLVWTAGGGGGQPGVGTAAAPVRTVQPATDRIVDRAFPGAAPQFIGRPEVGFLGATPVLVVDGSRVLDLATGEQLGAEITVSTSVSSPTVLQHGGRSLLIGTTFDHVVRMWDLATGETLPTTINLDDQTTFAGAAAEVDGRAILALSLFNNTIGLWDLDTGAPIAGPVPTGIPDGNGPEVRALGFVPVDGRTVLVGSGDGLLHAWDATTGAELYPPIKNYAPGYNGVPVATVGGRPITIAEEQFAGINRRHWTVYDLATGAKTADVTITTSEPVSLTPATVAEAGGRGVVPIGEGNDVVLFDLATGARVGTALTGHEAPVLGMAAASYPGGTVLITTSDDHSVRVWDLTARSGR